MRLSPSQAAAQRGQPARWRSISSQRWASTCPSSRREKRASTSGQPVRGRRDGAHQGRELLADGGAGAVEAALHRVDADAQRRGHLGRGQALDVAQHQHLAVGAREARRWRRSSGARPARGRWPPRPGPRRVGDRSRAVVARRSAVAASEPRGAAAALLDAEAPGDRVEPGARRRPGRGTRAAPARRRAASPGARRGRPRGPGRSGGRSGRRAPRSARGAQRWPRGRPAGPPRSARRPSARRPRRRRPAGPGPAPRIASPLLITHRHLWTRRPAPSALPYPASGAPRPCNPARRIGAHPYPWRMRGSAFMASLPPGEDLAARNARGDAVLEAVQGGVALPIDGSPVRAAVRRAPGHVLRRLRHPPLRRGRRQRRPRRLGLGAHRGDRAHRAAGRRPPRRAPPDGPHLRPDPRCTPTVVLSPHPHPPVLSTTARQLQHHAEIEKERAGRTGLLSTVGKEWILSVELFPASAPRHPLGKAGAINYGWHTEGPREPVRALPGAPTASSSGRRGASGTTSATSTTASGCRASSTRGCGSTARRRRPPTC